MMQLSEEALELRRKYARERAKAYREKNREQIRQKQKEWVKSNPDKVRLYQDRYWEKKAAELQVEQQ
jgi:hypothetical protein